MPFNIELSRSEPFVKLQISKNTITLYFYGPDNKKVEAALNAWDHLDGHFLSSMPQYNPNWVRGPDAPHIKRNHTHSGETQSSHFHREFADEVTPEILSAYLNNVWQQQNDPHHDAPVFKFFSKDEMMDILEKFTLYYKGYKGSSVETLYDEETRLTAEESESYERAVKGAKSPDLLTSLLLLSMFARSPAMLPTTNLAPESDDKCTIM